MKDITHLSETPEEYAGALTSAETLEQLRSVMKEYKPLVGDAEEIVSQWDAATFDDWRKALYLERHGRFMGEERARKGYAVVLMPNVLFHASMTALQFHVPWGAAYLRLKQVGVIKHAKGHDYVVHTEEAAS